MEGSFVSIDSERTLIIGRYGRLARALRYLFPNVAVVGRNEADIRDPGSLRRAACRIQPDLIINCAAMTDVAHCEVDPTEARSVNVEGVVNLSLVSKELGARLIHFSSDYASHPVNEYGRSKLEGEQYADLTIRAKIYDASHWAWEALSCGRGVRMTACEFSNPISTTSLGRLLPALLRMGRRGVVVLGTRERRSFFQIGQVWATVIGARIGLVEQVGRIESPYPRPTDTFMPVDDLVAAGIDVPDLEVDAREHRRHFLNYGNSAG